MFPIDYFSIKADIVKKLENSSNLTKDEIANLENELSEVIIELAKRNTDIMHGRQQKSELIIKIK